MTGTKRVRDTEGDVGSETDQPAPKKTSGRSNAVKKAARKSVEADLGAVKTPKRKARVAKKNAGESSLPALKPSGSSSQQKIRDIPVSLFSFVWFKDSRVQGLSTPWKVIVGNNEEFNIGMRAAVNERRFKVSCSLAISCLCQLTSKSQRQRVGKLRRSQPLWTLTVKLRYVIPSMSQPWYSTRLGTGDVFREDHCQSTTAYNKSLEKREGTPARRPPP